VLSDLPAPVDDRIVVDYRTTDDAGVFKWEGGPALVQTVDFFTPIVDDPYVYGQIAAANALSDVYAMGGRPLTALAIAGFPLADGPDGETIKAIFLGGHDKLREAGVALLGGHTVQDPEIKFGYAVTGAVDPDRVLTNAGAREGDVLYLTKPLGTGVIATALKFNRAPEGAVRAAVASMTHLNRDAAEAVTGMPPGVVHACTDITGFGLIGHACEMARASACTLHVEATAVGLLEGALDLAAANLPGGGRTNRQHFSGSVVVSGTVEPDRLTLFYDPQTSGGLLIAVAPAEAGELARRLVATGLPAVRIGRVGPASAVLLQVG
jgi:selenide, water dikinase